MLSELLTDHTIQVVKNDGLDWMKAIQKSASPLLMEGKINQEYIDAMINVVNQHAAVYQYWQRNCLGACTSRKWCQALRNVTVEA